MACSTSLAGIGKTYMKSKKQKVAYLGPEGTFAHLTAQKRFRNGALLVPAPSIPEVFEMVARGRANLGLVPLENSSAGFIYETVDQLVDLGNSLKVQEMLSLNVRLGLLGRSKKNIRVIHSHYAPLHHCQGWIRRHFPKAEMVKETSTAMAVKKAAETPHAAAIGNRDAAALYGLKVLEFPIQQDAENVTQFLLVGRGFSRLKACTKTSIVFTVPNLPGALYAFLTPFKNENVNLTRIVSRPVVGKPEVYIFMAELAGNLNQPRIKAALDRATLLATAIKNLGSYPVKKRYQS